MPRECTDAVVLFNELAQPDLNIELGPDLLSELSQEERVEAQLEKMQVR